jgi:cytochrome b pre-mRNA-processing protein 3
MSLLKRIFGSAEPDPKSRLQPLYTQIVAKAREPHWYVDGRVPDSIDGRFDMVAAVLTLVLLRLERSADHAQAMAHLTEIFVDDMDGQLRESGVGDVVVGKYVGKMMSALGGRLGAFRTGLESPETLEDVVARNIYRAETVAPNALSHVRQGLLDIVSALGAQSAERIIDGSAQW